MDLADVLEKHGIAPPYCGAGVGPGWVPLVDRLCTRLIELGWNKDCHQIKEKFGGLRFYIGMHSLEITEAIDAAEAESYRTCEECGAEGKPRDGGWIRTLCDVHANGRGVADWG
jgi:hypothetical protein